MLTPEQVAFFEQTRAAAERGFQVGDEAVAILDGSLVDTPPRRHESGRWYVLVQPLNSPPPDGANADWFIVSIDQCRYGLKCWVPSPYDLVRQGKNVNIKRIRCISRTEKAATCEVLDDPVMSVEGEEEPANVYDPDAGIVGDDDDSNRPYLLQGEGQ